ncbi:pathway-specific nitrogen regulator [Colletotrichum karsti]|uniref:Pathway-specific nitrogen regulator n=1 Tax=Colletotrichum karsti TaxID=1095194 RepID=A0A9P6LIW6_9PEZI|nr:pathway-specific nitrogen regulator [Colletotrichum karsti]KAF9874561.1 pathway-specific nitrogen regulator [Colletotrichum karsti]
MADDEVPTKVEEEKKVEVEVDDTKDDVKTEPVEEASREEVIENDTEIKEDKLEETETTPDSVVVEDTPAQSDDTAADDGKAETAENVDATTQDEPEKSDANVEKDTVEEDSVEPTADEVKPEESEPTPEPKQEADTDDTPPAEPESQPEDTEHEKSLEELESELAELEKAAAANAEDAPSDDLEKVDETPAESGDKSAPAVVVEEVKDEHDGPAEVREASRSSSSLRRASGQTEALIQAAAKEVLERLEAQTMETMRNRSKSPRDSMDSTNNGTEIHYDVRSDTTRRDSYDTRSEATRRESYDTRSQASYRDSPRESRRESRQSRRGRYSRRDSDAMPPPMHVEDGGDSSSQHGADSDVFSERSARSSLGSFDGGHMDHHHNKEMDWRSSKRSSRESDVSMSELSYYDREEFVPTIRGSQRMPFRTPSDVKAMQYSSPAQSVIGSPRSSKRPQMPTISRLGSPSASAQYSPKGRTTPTRLKVKKEPAPLVLLHVTLLPLRWQWAEILEATPSDNLSAEAKNLREAWHHLHDRVAETVCERGILLSHPQDDYEILEERLLEALDLPLRRRARVLECGHYIGPSNESTMTEELDSDEEDYDEEIRRRNALAKTHWCPTCRHDIRYESLGPGKIFRIKVYASNGLMRTGAWAACWKEMERVDVELEPIVTSGVLDELERLVIAQSQQMVKHENPTILESTEGRDMTDEHDMSAFDRDMSQHLERSMPALEEPPQEPSFVGEPNMIEPNYNEDESHARAPSPAPVEDHRSLSPEPVPRHNESEERRLRDEARMREIYGQGAPAPEPEHEYQHAPEPKPQPEEYAQTPPPQQPQEQPQQHYHEQPHQQQAPPPQPDNTFDHSQERQRFQNAGIGELLVEAARVFMQDKKNLAIVVMGLLMLFMAFKPAQREVKEWDGKFVEQVVPDVRIDGGSKAAAEPPIMETVQSVVESLTESTVSAETPVQVVVEPSEEAQVAEPSQEMPVAQPTASAEEPSESSASPVDGEEASSSSVESSETSVDEEEVSPSSVEDLVEEEPTPSPEPTSIPSEEVEFPQPVGVHQTITTREVIRIMETVTETVKAFVTETEVVKAQPTSSVASEVSLDDEAQVEEQNEELASESEADEAQPTEFDEAQATETNQAEATETAAPVEEPVESASEGEPSVEETTEQEAETEADDHDEL